MGTCTVHLAVTQDPNSCNGNITYHLSATRGYRTHTTRKGMATDLLPTSTQGAPRGGGWPSRLTKHIMGSPRHRSPTGHRLTALCRTCNLPLASGRLPPGAWRPDSAAHSCAVDCLLDCLTSARPCSGSRASTTSMPSMCSPRGRPVRLASKSAPLWRAKVIRPSTSISGSCSSSDDIVGTWAGDAVWPRASVEVWIGERRLSTLHCTFRFRTQ